MRDLEKGTRVRVEYAGEIDGTRMPARSIQLEQGLAVQVTTRPLPFERSDDIGAEDYLLTTKVYLPTIGQLGR